MEGYPLHYRASGLVHAAPADLFEHLDDPLRLSSHMQKPSMAMLGTSMHTQVDSAGGRRIGSVIRMSGRVLGVPIDLVQAIAQREPPRFKAWETVGEPQLLVVGRYRMGFEIEAAGAGSRLAVFIDYALPSSGPERLLGRLMGARYARWCCERMLQDAQAAMDAPAGASAARN